jgi:16S rRNA (cytosine967-C5)-methyltransferase
MAYRVLLDVQQGRRDLPQALASERTGNLDERDQALASEITIGTLRWRAALDYLIERASRRSLSALDPEVLTILRLTVYQIVHLTRVPPSAAVHDAVDLVREARKKSAAGFVNAVLRAIASEGKRPALPRKPAAGEPRYRERLLDFLGTSLSHPRWLTERWLSRFGEEDTEAWLRFNNGEAPFTLRANRLRTGGPGLAARLREHGVETTPTRFAPHGLLVASGNPLKTPLQAEGLFLVQDEASQLVGLMLPVKAGDRVLDACASPGGKTTEIVEQAGDGAPVVASDVRERRVTLLRETLARAGADKVSVTQADLRAGAPFKRVFDGVLLDAPCSGLGTLRRDPDLKWKRRPEDLGPLAGTERRMLEQAAEVVRPGGFLLYSTCSSEPEENEQVVAGFLASRADFAPADRRLVEERVPPAVLDEDGHLRTWPHVHGLEAFFAALLVRLR